MTLNEISNAFCSYFLTNDTFNLLDTNKIALSLNLIFDRAAEEKEFKYICTLALNKLVNAELIEEFTTNNFILVKPLQNYSQSVEISSLAAAEIAKLVTGADSMAINNKNIEDLIILTIRLLNQQVNNDE